MEMANEFGHAVMTNNKREADEFGNKEVTINNVEMADDFDHAMMRINKERG